MIGVIIRRVLALPPILLVVSFVVFMLQAMVPGDPAITLAGGPDATPERIEAIREELHLEESLVSQYVHWAGDAIHGDFGESIAAQESVSDELRRRFPITMSLALSAMVMTVLIGVPLGIASAVRPGGLIDRAARLVSSLGAAVPSFWLGALLIIVFAVRNEWLPPSGYVRFSDSPSQWLETIILPTVTLAAATSAVLARQLRAALLDVLDSDYIRTAWATGLDKRTVIGKRALKNGAIPAVTILGLQVGTLLGGTVIIEQVFGIPGIGNYFVTAIVSGDLPVIQGVVVLLVLAHVAVNLIVDLVYALLNPKVRVG